MKRFHVHVAVANLEQSIQFYSTFFDAAPTVTKEDYAKWMLDDPRINFAISTRGREPGLDHLGIQVEDADSLKEILSLYDFKESSATRALIASIIGLYAKPISAPLNFDGQTTLCRGIEIEITRALGQKVWLKSGGYIIIEQTEALTAIDVNTGRHMAGNLEDTVLETNLEELFLR